jgi:hypothetical protein
LLYSINCGLKEKVLCLKQMFDSKKVKDLLPKKMGRFRPTRGLSKIFVK